MSSIRKALLAFVCLALGVAMLAFTPTATAVAEVSAAPARAADSLACVMAKNGSAKALDAKKDAKQKVKRATKRVTAAKIKLAKAQAKKASKAKRAKAKKQLAKAKRSLKAKRSGYRTAKSNLATARSAEDKACHGGNPGTASQAQGLGSLLALLGTAGNKGTLPDLNPTQVAGLLDTLFPGASDLLTAGQLTDLFGAFGGVSSLDPTQLLDLLAGLPGGDSLDPAMLLALLSGDLDPTQLTTVLTSLLSTASSLLGELGGSFDLPANPVAMITSFLDLAQGFITNPAQALGVLLGLLSAAGNGGSVPGLDLGQFTTLLNGFYPGASTMLDPSQLSALLAGFSGSGGLDLAALTTLLQGLPGAGALDPSALVALLSGASLGGGQLSALTSVLTDLIGTLTGQSFSVPANPLGLVGGLLDALLGGILPDVPILPEIPGLPPTPLDPILCALLGIGCK